VGREEGNEENGDEKEAGHCISSARPLLRTIRGTPSFSSSTIDASAFLRLQEIAVQRGRKTRRRVYASAYSISGTALVNDTDSAENQTGA
jgi:hypothetical protein